MSTVLALTTMIVDRMKKDFNTERATNLTVDLEEVLKDTNPKKADAWASFAGLVFKICYNMSEDVGIPFEICLNAFAITVNELNVLNMKNEMEKQKPNEWLRS